MDTNSLVTLVIVLLIIYLVFKYIVSPLLKALGITLLTILALLLLRNLFHVSFNPYLGQYSQTFNIDSWLAPLDWVAKALVSYLANLLAWLLSFVPKTK